MPIEFVSGDRIHIECAGAGAPAIVFVHGGFCDRGDWNQQIRALSPEFRTVSFDLPGHGESSIPVSTSIKKLAHTVAEIALRQTHGKILLVGHSLGCPLILEAYREISHIVAGLVLVDGGLVPGGDDANAVVKTENILDSLGLPAFVAASFDAMFGDHCDPALRESVKLRAAKVDSVFAKQLLLGVAGWGCRQARQAMRAVKAPALILQSTQLDENFEFRGLKSGDRSAWIEFVSRNVSAAESVIVPGVGHFAMIEAAESISLCIGGFARRIARDGHAN